MRYICLVHADPQRFQSFTAERWQDIDRRSLAYNRELTEKGHYLAAEAIEDRSSAIMLRVRDGAVSTTDGPFMETKEQMAGFILIEAHDMNEALRLAAGIPMAELGTIEVRPVREIPIPP